MRKTLIWTLALAALTACAQDTSGPGWDELFAFSEDEFGTVAYGMAGVHPGRGLPELGRLRQLPDSIALTDEQEAEIGALLEAFQSANRADLDALAAIMDAARQARQAGKPREEVRAILAPARPIHLRLLAARIELRTAIDQVLTAEQKAWLLANRPPRCNPATVPPLSDAQKAQIRALRAAFTTANRADLDAVAAAVAQARAARASGATREQIQAIFEPVKPALARLRTAGDQLRTAIDALLTPEQRASGCFARGPHRPGMMHRP